jgi:hypothetical protein
VINYIEITECLILNIIIIDLDSTDQSRNGNIPSN